MPPATQDNPSAVQHLARILRTDPVSFTALVSRMERLTGKTDVLAKIYAENSQKIDELLSILRAKDRTYETVAETLQRRLIGDDHALFHALGDPDLASVARASKMVETARRLVSPPAGLFLKHERASAILKQNPPPQLMQALGYSAVDSLLAQEDLRELFSALRFVESRDWMNGTFLKAYSELTPADFEVRPVEVIVLDTKWLTIASKFIEKKYHNVSHLKELGLIFVIPLEIDTPGETLLVFSLVLHYLNEVHFYARLIERYSRDDGQFTPKLISLLRGDVGEVSVLSGERLRWLIVQRYLSKENEHDPRLFAAHTNSEALHWHKAEQAIAKFAQQSAFSDLAVWSGLGYIGDFLPRSAGGEALISFNLIDTAVELVRGRSSVKYLYHHQEALWNRIFAGYFSAPGQLEEYIVANFDKGYIELEG